MQQDTVFMRSPEGEVREVVATSEALSPLMAKGWTQAKAPAQPVIPVLPEEK